MKALGSAAFAAVALFAATAAGADNTVTVTSIAGTPTSTKWGTFASENPGGTTAITTAAPRSGNGSIELRGDRTRVQLGNQYDFPALGFPISNLMPASSVSGLAFDWQLALDDVALPNPDYTPALRLVVQSGNQRSELIWEGVYNGTYGNTTKGTWYSTTFNDLFYQNVSGSGVTLNNGAQVNQSLSAWLATYGSSAFVSAISVGDGSGAGPAYHAYVDNVRLRTTDGTVTTYNFETQGPVPEPASWAMMIVGVGAIGYTMRRRRVAVRVRYAA